MSIVPTFKARCRRCGRSVTSAVPVDLCPICSLGALMTVRPDDLSDDLDTSEPTNKPATLNELAAECHRLAVARGKYAPGWTLLDGAKQLTSEVVEWVDEAFEKRENREAEELGDLLHTVLSIGHHRGIDVDAALAGAMRRNAARAEDGA